jgi:hypothetical protein
VRLLGWALLPFVPVILSIASPSPWTIHLRPIVSSSGPRFLSSTQPPPILGLTAVLSGFDSCPLSFLELRSFQRIPQGHPLAPFPKREYPVFYSTESCMGGFLLVAW